MKAHSIVMLFILAMSTVISIADPLLYNKKWVDIEQTADVVTSNNEDPAYNNEEIEEALRHLQI